MDTRELSFSSAMNSLPTGGRMVRHAWGNITRNMVWPRLKPRDRAASVWPLSMDMMPARKTSPMYAP